MNNNNNSVVENMMAAFAHNGNLVAEPQFFGIAVSDHFEKPVRLHEPNLAESEAFQVGRQIAQETVAQLKEMDVFQYNPTFFGTPVEDYLNLLEANIWDKILQDVSEYKAFHELS